MKKRIMAILVAAVLCMGATGALAAYGRGYVDADGDGVCDNAGTGCGMYGAGRGYVDADGDGVCDNAGMGCGMYGAGRGYVDADGDGVCDNAGYGAYGAGRGARRGR